VRDKDRRAETWSPIARSASWLSIQTTRHALFQIRGDAELITDGAVQHVDGLTRKYTRHPRYYGFIYLADQQTRETRAICRMQTEDGSFASTRSRVYLLCWNRVAGVSITEQDPARRCGHVDDN
jgi:hypothetical protein